MEKIIGNACKLLIVKPYEKRPPVKPVVDRGVTLILLSHIRSCDHAKYQSQNTDGFTCFQPPEYKKVSVWTDGCVPH
jgi:hypothetical protein